jgi:hypothetical protein
MFSFCLQVPHSRGKIKISEKHLDSFDFLIAEDERRGRFGTLFGEVSVGSKGVPLLLVFFLCVPELKRKVLAHDVLSITTDSYTVADWCMEHTYITELECKTFQGGKAILS